MAAAASTAPITSKWDRQGERGGLQNIKHVDTNKASNQICPVVVFASSNTKRPNVAVCSQKFSLFSPISVSLTLRHRPLLLLLLLPPFGHKPSRYWSKLPFQCARGAGRASQSGVAIAEGQEGEPISRMGGREGGAVSVSMWSESWWEEEMAVRVWLYC